MTSTVEQNGARRRKGVRQLDADGQAAALRNSWAPGLLSGRTLGASGRPKPSHDSKDHTLNLGAIRQKHLHGSRWISMAEDTALPLDLQSTKPNQVIH